MALRAQTPSLRARQASPTVDFGEMLAATIRILDRIGPRGLRWRADERESSYGDAIFSKAFGRNEQPVVFKRELHAPGGRPDARQRSTAARRDHLSAGLTTCVYTQYLPSASGPRRVA